MNKRWMVQMIECRNSRRDLWVTLTKYRAIDEKSIVFLEVSNLILI